MKKFLIAFAAVVAIFGSTSALAQSANETMFVQRMNDPAYQAATHSYAYGYGGGYSYGYSYGYGYAYVPPVLGLIGMLVAGNPHKPANGELRTLPDGTTVSYDKQLNRWVPVNKPEQQPRGVYSDRDVYAAQ